MNIRFLIIFDLWDIWKNIILIMEIAVHKYLKKYCECIKIFAIENYYYWKVFAALRGKGMDVMNACMRAQANEWKFAPCFVLLPTYGAQAFSEDGTWGQYHIVFLKLYYKKSHPKRIKNSLLVALSLTTIKVFDRHCNSCDLP